MRRKKILLMLTLLCAICGLGVLTSCSNDDTSATVEIPQQKEYFTQWNQCEALTALQEYVEDVMEAGQEIRDFVRNGKALPSTLR